MSHTESLEKEIRKYVAEYISREASRKSLITITRCAISSDTKRAVLFVSVLPDKAEPIAMDFLKRHQDYIRKYAQQNSKIRAVPWLRFSLDRGEKNRQLVDELLRDDDK
jgi:ribosome-binding factor A